MISGTLLRFPSPRSTSLLLHLTRLPQPSSPFSKPSICPNNGATFITTAAAGGRSSTVSEVGRKFPRPSTITWSPRLQNSVSLIGAVEYPLTQYNSTEGKFGVYTSLRVKTTADSDSFFSITLAMWDELAEQAMLHLKPNDFIYISGELGSYIKSTLEGLETVRYKVTAKELNYIELDKPGTNSKKVANPGKETGESFGESAVQKFKGRLHLWQVFFANPNDWYDNRKNKKNPRAPDFKHKSTGEAVWINATDPPWVKKQLELHDSRHSGRSDSDMNLKFSSTLMSDEQLTVPSPTVEELNCINLDEGGKNSYRAVNSRNETGKKLEEPSSLKRTNRLQLLEKLFATPDEWDDLRKSKKSLREPDFKHRSTGEELWLNANDPLWVNKELVLLEAKRSRRPNNNVSSKSSWVSDEQLIVPNPTVSTQGAVNSENLTGKSSSQKKNNRLELLQNLFANPEVWYDNRKIKKNPKQPDFKHKFTGEVIWLNETDSTWIKEQVGILDSRLSGGPTKAVVS